MWCVRRCCSYFYYSIPIWQWRIQNIIGFGLGGLVSLTLQNHASIALTAADFCANLQQSAEHAPRGTATLCRLTHASSYFLQFFTTAGLLLFIQMSLARCCIKPDPLVVSPRSATIQHKGVVISSDGTGTVAPYPNDNSITSSSFNSQRHLLK